MPKKVNYEDAIQKLENIINKLEDSQTPLEESIKLYKEGVDLAKLCSEKLENFEGELAILKKTTNGLFKKEAWLNE